MPINNPSTNTVDNGIYNPSTNSVGDGISNIGAGGGGGGSTPELDFSKASNSMYIPLLFGYQIQ